MARSRNNDATFGLSGRFGKMFSFRQLFGRTLATRRPGKRTGPGTSEQEQIKSRFKEGTIYGKGVIADPIKRALYGDLADTGISAYNRSIRDFMKPPVVASIDTTNYHGDATDTIKIRATDDFQVAVVKVSIHTAAGELVEEGNAVAEANGADWLYSVSGENEAAVGSKIKATAIDLPGNISSLEVTV
jgi:hypothetical protein